MKYICMYVCKGEELEEETEGKQEERKGKIIREDGGNTFVHKVTIIILSTWLYILPVGRAQLTFNTRKNIIIFIEVI